MTASDHLSQQQGAMQYYHGTNVRLKSMAVIRPGAEVGRSNFDHYEAPLSQVCMTCSRDTAEQHARMIADEHGGDAHVYRVRPLSAPEHVAGDEYRTSRAQVIHGHRVS